MPKKTFGAQLQQLEALKKPAHDAYHDKDENEEAERLAVVRFFDDAKAYIQRTIAAGKRPAGIELGSSTRSSSSEAAGRALSLYSWPHGDKVVPTKNKYRSVWDEFTTWTASQQLFAWFEEEHDGVGVRSWKVLHVKADMAKLGPPPDMAEGAVVLPKDVIARYGSAQAYMDHLMKQAGVSVS